MRLFVSDFEKLRGHKVKILPPPRRFDDESELRIREDEWIILAIHEKFVHLVNERSRLGLFLNNHEISYYSKEPNPMNGGKSHEVVVLTVQLVTRGPELIRIPVERPGLSYKGPVEFLGDATCSACSFVKF